MASQAFSQMKKIRLGFGSHSLPWKAPRLRDYAAEQKLDSIQLCSINDSESLEPPLPVVDQEDGRAVAASLDTNGPPAEYLAKGLRTPQDIGLRRCGATWATSPTGAGAAGCARREEGSCRRVLDTGNPMRDIEDALDCWAPTQ